MAAASLGACAFGGGSDSDETPASAAIVHEVAPVRAGETAQLPKIDVTNLKQRLIGLSSNELGEVLGTPNLQRAELPALLWQYRQPNCTIDIFMFDDGRGAKVDHVELRPSPKTPAEENACFAAIVRSAPKAAAGGSSAPRQSPNPAS